MFGHVLLSCSGFKEAKIRSEKKVHSDDQIMVEFKHESSSLAFRFFDFALGSWFLGSLRYYHRVFCVMTTRRVPAIRGG